MALPDTFSACAVLGASAYYLFAWILFGRDPKRGTIVPLYQPPLNLSPALVRFIWKEQFDDRTFWASALSIVAKGLATMYTGGEQAILRARPNYQNVSELPVEEKLFLDKVRNSNKRKGISVSMLDSDSADLASKMADSLRKAAVGRWFQANRNYLFIGIVLSGLAVTVVARPSNRDQLMAFVFGISIMIPAAFYLLLLLLRIKDLFRAIERKLEPAVVKRGAILLIFVTPCLAAILVGSVVLEATFGWPTVIVLIFLTVVTLFFAQAIKTRTTEGRLLMDKIEGFRIFLQSVERFPLDRDQGPGSEPTLYERYLPYAVALEVEQHWGDRFVALASTLYQDEAIIGARRFYLGMWNGKPVEIMFKPEMPKSGRI
jgi:hypothetical protein